MERNKGGKVEREDQRVKETRKEGNKHRWRRIGKEQKIGSF